MRSNPRASIEQGAVGLSLALALVLAGCSGADASAATYGKMHAAANGKAPASKAAAAAETYPIAPEVIQKDPAAAVADKTVDAPPAAIAPIITPLPGPSDSRPARDRPPTRKSIASARSLARGGAVHGSAPGVGHSNAAQEIPAVAPVVAPRPVESPAPLRAQPSEAKKRLPLVDDQPRINIVD